MKTLIFSILILLSLTSCAQTIPATGGGSGIVTDTTAITLGSSRTHAIGLNPKITFDSWQLYDAEHNPLAYKSYDKIVILDKEKALAALAHIRSKLQGSESILGFQSIERDINDQIKPPKK